MIYQIQARQVMWKWLALAALFFASLCTSSISHAAVIQWVSPNSGDWSVASNWSTGTVPGADDDVVIDVPNERITVSIVGRTVIIRSLNCQENISINGGSLSLTGLSEVTGDFSLLNGGKLSVDGSGVIFVASGSASINNGRFEILGGAVAEIRGATSFIANFLEDSVISVSGLESRLDLSAVIDLRVGGDAEGVHPQLFEARDGGVLDFSGVAQFVGTPGSDDPVTFSASNGGQILLSSLSVLLGQHIRLMTSAGGVIDLSSLGELGYADIQCSAVGLNSLIDFEKLCVYENATFQESSGGRISHRAVPRSGYLSSALFGIGGIGQEGSCIGNQCSLFSLYSLLPGTGCFRGHGIVRSGQSQIDVDGLAAHPFYGLVGFELVHVPETGGVLGSRLVGLKLDDGSTLGSGELLPGREIRGAAFRGEDLFAIDAGQNQLLRISPVDGSLIGEPLPLTLSGQAYDIGRLADLAINEFGEAIVVDFRSWFSLNMLTGALVQRFSDNAPLADGTLPGLAGAAYANDTQANGAPILALSVSGADKILAYAQDFSREAVYVQISEPAHLDGTSGDLTTVVDSDTTAPGPVPITIFPFADGTSVRLDWGSYSEEVNGGDISHYTVYGAPSSFTNAANATVLGTTVAGTKTFQLRNLPRGQRIFLAVVASDRAGNQNLLVTSASVLPVDIVAPGEVTGLTGESGANFVRVFWQPPGDSDLGSYRIYRNGSLVAQNVHSSQWSYTLLGLTPATFYDVQVRAVDNNGNVNNGASIGLATWLPNPTGVTVQGANGRADIHWSPVVPANLIQGYRVYVSESAFSSIEGLTPALMVPAGATFAQVAGLENDQTYFLAVTTVNISGGETQSVTPVSVRPVLDHDGPSILNPTIGGAPLVDGSTLRLGSLISVTAQDTSGVSLVRFGVDSGSGEQILGVDTAGPDYTAFWDLSTYTEGQYTLRVRAEDNLGNVSVVSFSLVVDLAEPAAPRIVAPQTGAITSSPVISVVGLSDRGTQVRLFINDTVVGDLLTVDSVGGWATNVTLSRGLNSLSVEATGRGGISARRAPVVVTFDDNIPIPPAGVYASSREGGEIKLGWSAVQDERQIRYNIYRASLPFEQAVDGQKLNAQPLSGTTYSDLPQEDGTYYYRVSAVSPGLLESPLSAQVFAIADSTPPRAVSIDYVSSGAVDPLSGRFAPGEVSVTLTVSEALLTSPFLSITPQGGMPITLELSWMGGFQYRGYFTIGESTPSGVARAVFSARDMTGNRGSQVLAGATLEIDTDGPTVNALSVSPGQPIRNEASEPSLVNFEFTLSERPASSSSPLFKYILSGSNRTPTNILGIAATDPQRRIWQGSFTLPPDAGLESVESFSFILSSQDDLGNIGTRIDAPNIFQVYQGELPPLAVPTGLSALARPAGAVQLGWNAVEGAVGYQLYRKGPDAAPEEPLIPYGERLTGLNFNDQTSADGEYQYAVASVRSFNSQEAVSAQSAPVSVTADSVSPNAPQDLVLELFNGGIRAQWGLPQGGVAENGELTYSLYRADLAPGEALNPSGFTPIQSAISALETVDSSPTPLQHAYAVTAVDLAGNESAASNTFYLNFELLPVRNLSVSYGSPGVPQVSWSHDGSDVESYRLELIEDGHSSILQDSTITNYSDAGYTGGDRRYRVIAIDDNDAESAGHEILLPALSATLPEDFVIARGVFNRLPYSVTNAGSSLVSRIRLRGTVRGQLYESDEFTLAGGETRSVELIVGGGADLSSREELVTTLHIEPQAGDSVDVSSSRSVSVSGSAMVLQLETQNMIRGATGQVRFSLENTSLVRTEIVTARGNAQSPSDEVRFKLVDQDGNVHSVKHVQQGLGANVVTVPSGHTVARVEPSARFTSDWFSIEVPDGLPEESRLELEIDRFHYQLGYPQHLSISGHGTSRAIDLEEPRYFGEITSITPELSYGDEPIVITGRALEAETLAALAHTRLDLVLGLNGFERIITVYTGPDGNFTYRHTPGGSDRGRFSVSAVYPGALEHPEQAAFVIGGVAISPGTFNIRIPRNYQAEAAFSLRALGGFSAANLRLEYLAEDQSGYVIPPGITLTLPLPMNLAAGESRAVTIPFSGGNSAPQSGWVRLRVVSDTSGARPLGFVLLNFEFSSAAPSIQFNPPLLEMGVVNGGTVISQGVVVKNSGLAALVNARLSLLTYPAEQPVPNWLHLTSPANYEIIEVGQERRVELLAAPDDDVPAGYHQFILRVAADGGHVRDLPVVIAVTPSGVGNLLVHVADIYTGTLNGEGEPIQGLSGARVKIQNEDVSGIQFEGYTDAFGEILLEGIPAGNYALRVSAGNHSDQLLFTQIQPGVTKAEDVFLMNSLVIIEWSVDEIEIGDYYQIILNAVYETDVPVAVLVFQPVGVQLPDMRQGDVFYGELSLMNYGLINATGLSSQFPTSDEFARYEFLAAVPDVLAAGQRVTIPYRITALQDFSPAEDGAGSGGGRCDRTVPVCVRGAALCANGHEVEVGACSYFLDTHACSTSSPAPGGFVGGGVPGGGGTSWVPGGGIIPSNIPCLPGLFCDKAVGDPND